MLFSSISFIYYFLPVVLILYFLVPHKQKNFVLLVASLFFYFYGEPVYSALMVLSSLSGYLHGLWIEKAKSWKKYRRIPLISSIVIAIGVLLYFKYADFIIENVNWLFGKDTSLLRLALPLGISFYTFQILSYTIDVYRGTAQVQRSFLDFSTYVSLFPQLIAGPIVRYTTVEAELNCRTHSWKNCAYGINRFIIGLSKKIILANTLGELGRLLSESNQKTVLMYWILAFAFMLQVYFDFSGYSDMAIGLGRIFGFKFLENFNYPYISTSISEFWRRWHISLGTWFRDYVYIPMGGSRVGKIKWIRNIIVVWFLTGFWHGAQWNFIFWGLYFAVLLTVEKLFMSVIEKVPALIRHLYVLCFLTISFVFFNADGMGKVVENLKGMVGISGIPFINKETTYYLRSYMVVLVISAISATPLFTRAVNKLKTNKKCERLLNTIEPLVHVLLMLVVTAFLIDGSFNPFLYFRF
jgi:alginate O-acetyltransferase complex protein AlgI